MQNQFIPQSFCYMLWLLIILIFLLTFLGMLYFHFEYLLFLLTQRTDQSCLKNGANDLASLQNHSTFGDKLVCNWWLRFKVRHDFQTKYFVLSNSFVFSSKPPAIEEGFFFCCGFQNDVFKHTVDKKMEHGCTLKFHSTFATLRLY